MIAMPSFQGNAYQARIDALAATGMDMHGEARMVMSFAPATVLDAGCGTGRVAIELARQGIEVVGVDVNGSMLAEAERRSAGLGRISWKRADLAGLELGRTFDAVLLAGNVPLFCPVADRAALVTSCAGHVGPGGVMIAGFQLDERYSLADWDQACASAGLELESRWSTWDGDPFLADAGGTGPASDYAVSVHRRPA
jgi:SAM-dependent methyltransferase